MNKAHFEGESDLFSMIIHINREAKIILILPTTRYGNLLEGKLAKLV